MITEFLKPVSVEEAVSIKNEKAGSMYYGGGTSINYPPSGTAAGCVIGLENLGLKNMETKGDTLVIGSMVTIQELIDSVMTFSALREAASFIYSRNIRNIATLGGNIGADLRDSAIIPCLMALSAQVETAEEGMLPVEEYISLEKSSLILSVHISKPKGSCRVKKISRSAGSSPILQAAVYIEGSWGTINEAVIAVGGVVPKTIRLAEAEKGLKSGKILNSADLVIAAADAAAPETDHRGSAEYKRYITGVTVAECADGCMRRG